MPTRRSAMRALRARCCAKGATSWTSAANRPGPAHARPARRRNWQRVLPVLRHAVTLGVPVSVDTSEPLVMRAALDLGVDIVNDVRALRRPGALDVLAAPRDARASA